MHMCFLNHRQRHLNPAMNKFCLTVLLVLRGLIICVCSSDEPQHPGLYKDTTVTSTGTCAPPNIYKDSLNLRMLTAHFEDPWHLQWNGNVLTLQMFIGLLTSSVHFWSQIHVCRWDLHVWQRLTASAWRLFSTSTERWMMIRMEVLRWRRVLR